MGDTNYTLKNSLENWDVDCDFPLNEITTYMEIIYYFRVLEKAILGNTQIIMLLQVSTDLRVKIHGS